jgi:hypothetical protein
MSLTTTTGGGLGLVPQSMDQAMRLAEMMAVGKLVPSHLQRSPGDCLMVIEQAMRWGMSPFAVAQSTSVIQGKLMFEGKLVAAALHASGALATRLAYDYAGEGAARLVRVSAVLAGETEPRAVEVKLADAKTTNGMWTKQPDQQLAYHGARVWARRYAPEVMLGVYTPEEMEPAPAFHAGPTIEARAEVAQEPDRIKDGADALAAQFASVATAQDYYGILDDEKTAKQMVWLKANRPELFATVDAARVAASERMADTPAPEEPAYDMENAR